MDHKPRRDAKPTARQLAQMRRYEPTDAGAPSRLELVAVAIAVAGGTVPRAQVVHLAAELRRLVHVAARVLGLDIEIVDGVRVKGLLALALEDVSEAGRTG